MDIQVIIIAFTILIVAWALVKILDKIKAIDEEISELRIKIIGLDRKFHKFLAMQNINLSPDEQNENVVVHCPICGAEFDRKLDKCPKCGVLNLEKFN